MRTDHVLCLGTNAFHRIHYTDWGDPASPRIAVCVHGLTRNCRDFDFLAQALAGNCRVVCPDIAGRGQSDWLTCKEDYSYPQYMGDVTALLARVTATPRTPVEFQHRCGVSPSIHWVGTSMGGMIGMLLAACPNSPIRKLVVNDIGPLIPKAALERIAAYVGDDPRFRNFEELLSYVRQISAPFGPLTDAQWHHLTLHGARQHDDGSWGMCYDPDIALPMRNRPLQDIDLWRYWDAITCPTLVLRGAESDLLPGEIVKQMRTRGPRPRVVEFSGVGHAPMLMAQDQIAVVRDFLQAD